MFYLNVWLTVKDATDTERVRELLAEQGRLSRAEPGCVRFEVYHSQSDPRRFLLHEHWESPQAIDVHRKGQAYTQIYQPQVLPLVDREAHPASLIG